MKQDEAMKILDIDKAALSRELVEQVLIYFIFGLRLSYFLHITEIQKIFRDKRSK